LDDVKDLVRTTAQIAATTPAGQLEGPLVKNSGQWLHRAKRNYLEDRSDVKGEMLTSQELAELVVLRAEEDTWAQLKGEEGADEPDVSSKKHGQLVELLRKKIDGLEEAKREQILVRPADFIAERVHAVVNAEKEVFYQKTGKKLVGQRDPEHLSIRKRVWVKQLAAMK
jgi:hypothetical protein